jgi:hypothetical protein
LNEIDAMLHPVGFALAWIEFEFMPCLYLPSTSAPQGKIYGQALWASIFYEDVGTGYNSIGFPKLLEMYDYFSGGYTFT